MRGRTRDRRTATSLLASRLECLEPRRLLSASDLPPGITAVQLEKLPGPAGGRGTQATELVISFDQADVNAIDSELSSFFGSPYDFAFLINNLDGNADIELDGPSGTVFGFADPPSVETVSSNGVVTNVSIPIDNSLAPGTYQVSLNWGSDLDFLFSMAESSATNPFWTTLASASDPATITQLTVQSDNGPTLAQATPLKTIGSTNQNVWGTLDPENVQSAVDLYKFTLAPGHLWQVGLEVSAWSIGSPLLPALSLFDGQGNLLATRNSGTGIPSDPNDPYLFAGLQPGTYYVGVSGAGNLPDARGGYNPVTGAPGGAGLNQPGGPFPFELSLVATPHDKPTTVVSVSLNHQDHNDPSPSSITLTFSAPIDLSHLFTPDVQETALDVVDSSGHVWPITAEDFQVNGDRLTLIFDQALARGNYSLIDPAAGGLTDLAGVPVVTPGQPAGVLASWTVAADTAPSNPDDLGTLWPSSGGIVWPTNKGALSGTTAFAPGQETTFQWVVIVPGVYKLQTEVEGSEIEIVNSGNGTTTVLDTGSTNYLNNYLMTLGTGAYELRMTDVGLQPALVHWSLTIESLDWEKIIDNGVNATSALSLLTFSPALTGPETGALQGFMSVAASPSGVPLGGAIGPVPASLFVTLNTGLIGQPAWNGQPLAPLVSPVEANSIAQAGGFSGQSLSAGNGSLQAPADEPDAESSAATEEPAVATVPNDRPSGTTSNSALASLDSSALSSRADAGALARAEWVVRLGSVVQYWFASSLPDARSNPSAGEPPAPRLVVGNQSVPGVGEATGSRRNRPVTSRLHGDLGAAASLIMVGAVAYRMREPLRKWWRMRGQLGAPTQGATRRLLPGPHRTANTSRVATCVRRVGLPR
jgi:hypothetical protein